MTKKEKVILKKLKYTNFFKIFIFIKGEILNKVKKIIVVIGITFLGIVGVILVTPIIFLLQMLRSNFKIFILKYNITLLKKREVKI